MADEDTFNVAILATDGFEDVELTEPAKALGQAGATVDVIAPHGEQIQAFRHHDKSSTVPMDLTLDPAKPADHDALLLSGGALNADAVRVVPQMQRFVQAMAQAGKPMAVICHAPWELISAGLARGKTMTSYHTIQDDARNAGTSWVDQDVVVDGKLVTSRQPSEIAAFNREMLKLFSLRPQAAMR